MIGSSVIKCMATDVMCPEHVSEAEMNRAYLFVNICYLLIAVKSPHRDAEIVSLSTPSTTTPPTRKALNGLNFCNPMVDLWCYIENQNMVFPITIQPDRTIGHLAVQIKETWSNLLQTVDAPTLTLTKVRYVMLFM